MLRSANPLASFSRPLQDLSDQANMPEGEVGFRAETGIVTRVGSLMPLVHGMLRWRLPRWDELRKRRSTW